MKLCIRVPTNDRPCRGLVRWLLAVAHATDADINLTFTYGYGIAEGRNLVTQEFKKTDCTHLWMIDDDVTPPAHLRLLDLAEEHPVVCGPYRCYKDGNILWHVYQAGRKVEDWQYYEALPRTLWPEGRPFHVPVAGTGCMVIQRDVFDRVGWTPWKFKTGWIQDEYKLSGEDFDFCEQLGGVMMDPEYICGHESTMDLSIKGIQP